MGGNNTPQNRGTKSMPKVVSQHAKKSSRPSLVSGRAHDSASHPSTEKEELTAEPLTTG